MRRAKRLRPRWSGHTSLLGSWSRRTGNLALLQCLKGMRAAAFDLSLHPRSTPCLASGTHSALCCPGIARLGRRCSSSSRGSCLPGTGLRCTLSSRSQKRMRSLAKQA